MRFGHMGVGAAVVLAGFVARADAQVPVDDYLKFDRVEHAAYVGFISSITFAPDGSLFGVSPDGRVFRWRLSRATGLLAPGSSRELVTNVGAPDTRTLGIVFDRFSSDDDLLFYTSRSPDGFGVTFLDGTISRVHVDSGGQVKRSDFVTGLPSGFHQVNNLTIGHDGNLYIGQGSVTTAGAPDSGSFETTLIAAILRVDLAAVQNAGGSVDVDTSGADGRVTPLQTFEVDAGGLVVDFDPLVDATGVVHDFTRSLDVLADPVYGRMYVATQSGVSMLSPVVPPSNIVPLPIAVWMGGALLGGLMGVRAVRPGRRNTSTSRRAFRRSVPTRTRR